MRIPFSYVGGKHYMVKNLLPLIPRHITYVEVFGGVGHLLFAKDPNISKIEVYNDIDSNLVNLFRVIRNKDKFEEFTRLVSLTLYSREEHNYCKDNIGSCEDDIEKARMFFVMMKQSFNSCFGTWRHSITFSRRGIAGTCSGYLGVIEKLPEIHARIMRVQIENDSFEKIISKYDTPDTFFYLDPPYLHNTRKSKKYYKNEMADEQHELLIDILLKIKGKALLSGYDNEIYRKLENNGWWRKEFVIPCHAIGKTRHTGIQGAGSMHEEQRRIESVWGNYTIDND